MAALANAFMERIILSLLPFFIATTPDLDRARAAIVNAIRSYGARTQAEINEVAQILALGFCTVDSLAESTGIGMSVNKRLRLRGNATALVRSKKSCQQALADSLYMEIVEPARPEPIDIEPARPEPIDIEPEATALAVATVQAREKMQHPDRPAAASMPDQAAPAPRPAATPPTEKQKNAMLWANVMNQVASNLVQNNGPAPG